MLNLTQNTEVNRTELPSPPPRTWGTLGAPVLPLSVTSGPAVLLLV